MDTAINLVGQHGHLMALSFCVGYTLLGRFRNRLLAGCFWLLVVLGATALLAEGPQLESLLQSSLARPVVSWLLDGPWYAAALRTTGALSTLGISAKLALSLLLR